MPLPVLGDEETNPQAKSREPPEDEKKLLAEAKNGDTEAFGKLVERYQRRVYTVIYRFVRNHTEADDLAQEAFIRAFKAIDRFDLRYPFSPWMYRIAINLTLNHLKKRRLPMVDADLERKPSADNPVSVLEQVETRRKVHAAIARLPIKLRQVLVLRVYEDWPYAQIAQVLDIPIGTVMSRLARAREAVKEELKELL
ncbi:MAG: sigma-70 family RNA polymerase sigma factor [candidate division WOR-3 bacterium]|nr:sigma-70 family RNA polymerase sigma factor [candidate division WOR-3 bacterium]